jgi:hypothetical protein
MDDEKDSFSIPRNDRVGVNSIPDVPSDLFLSESYMVNNSSKKLDSKSQFMSSPQISSSINSLSIIN